MAKNGWACVAAYLAACLLAGNPLLAQETPPVADEPPVGQDVGPRAGTLWFRADYLLWKVQGTPVPALVGTISTTQAELIQQLPSSAITPLVGDYASGIAYRPQSGFRLEAGVWIDEAQQWGLQAGFFQVGQGRQSFQATSQAGRALGPVFFRDPAFSQEALIMDAVPGLRAGGVSVQASQHLWGAEANAMRRLWGGGVLGHLDLLVGFRHVQFSEGLLIQGTSRSIPGGQLPCGWHELNTLDGTVVPSNPAPTADELSYSDQLGVRNQYFAPQVGLSAATTYLGFFVEATGKLGMGLLHATGTVEGQTRQRSADATTTQSGGVLAPPGGASASENRFVILPEVSLRGGYQLASWCRLTVGYNLLYASDVVRVSSLVGAVDARQVPQLPSFDPTTTGAAAHLRNSSLWVQGLTGGVEVRYWPAGTPTGYARFQGDGAGAGLSMGRGVTRAA